MLNFPVTNLKSLKCERNFVRGDGGRPGAGAPTRNNANFVIVISNYIQFKGRDELCLGSRVSLESSFVSTYGVPHT